MVEPETPSDGFEQDDKLMIEKVTSQLSTADFTL